MRKTLALLLTTGLAVGVLAAPGHAGAKKKTIEDTIDVTAAPLPNYSSNTGTPTPGCTAGEEGIHKLTTPLHVPGKGKLTVDLTGFQGDWDLYVFNGAGLVLARSENVQIPPDLAEPVEEISLSFKKMADIGIVACNWAGGPQAQLHYKLVYTQTKKAHHH